MYACMHAYCVCAYMRMYVCVHIHTSWSICFFYNFMFLVIVHACLCTGVRTYVRMYVCMYVGTYVCMYVCMYVNMYICMFSIPGFLRLLFVVTS